RDGHQRDLHTGAPQSTGRQLGLRQGEPRAARADPHEGQTETFSRSAARSARLLASSASSLASRSSRASFAAMIATQASTATKTTRYAAATYFSAALKPTAPAARAGSRRAACPPAR